MSWHERKRPICLEQRFEFDNYSATRDFLDKPGEHSEATHQFPDIPCQTRLAWRRRSQHGAPCDWPPPEDSFVWVWAWLVWELV